MKKLYGVCETFEQQKNVIKKHCFGDCGKIKIGGMTYNNLAFLPCYETDCPHEDKKMKFGEVDIMQNGNKEILYFRKLKEQA